MGAAAELEAQVVGEDAASEVARRLPHRRVPVLDVDLPAGRQPGDRGEPGQLGVVGELR